MNLHEQVSQFRSVAEASRKLDIPRTTLRRWLKDPSRGLPSGVVTHDKQTEKPGFVIPDGYRIKGTSTLYGDDGTPKLQWVKSQIDHEEQRRIFEEMRAGFCDVIPRAETSTLRPEISTDSDLLTMYVMTDAHIGMHSWGEETGADWDLKIAEETIMSWFKMTLHRTPNASHALFAQLGDFVHYAGMKALTPESGHLLDADGRFQKMIRVAVRVLRRCIALLLEKHETVHVILATGNHDDSVAAMFREVVPVFYENEPRITFDKSPGVYYAYKFGRVGLYFTHGHKSKFGSVDTVMVSKFRDIFGSTDYGYLHQGHLHHRDLKEGNLLIREIHPTLAAPDAYAANGGWLSKRSASAITYDRRYGEITRHTTPVEMLKNTSVTN